jgi:hypothetical protein
VVGEQRGQGCRGRSAVAVQTQRVQPERLLRQPGTPIAVDASEPPHRLRGSRR